MSSSNVEVVTVAEIPTLEINTKVGMMAMPKTIGKSYKKLGEYLEAKKGSMQGEPYVRYLEIDWDRMMNESKLMGFLKMFTRKWVMQIGFPVAEKIEGEGEIKAGHLTGGEYLSVLHTGSYQSVGESYNKLYAYAKEKGLSLRPECLEKYLNDPQEVKKEELQTLVMIPLDS